MKILLRIEAFSLFSLTLLGYFALWHFKFSTLILLLFLFDLSMLGYLFNPKVGAICYNLAHNLILPTVFLLLGWWLAQDWLLILALSHFAHIFMDRTLGFGLKDRTQFKHTHLS